jgi:hypothetical protein
VRLVVHAFPIDPGLPTLIGASDPAIVGGIVSEAFDVAVSPTVELIRYPREGSCVLRYDFPSDRRAAERHEAFSLYGKVYPDDRGLIVEGLLAGLKQAQASDRGLADTRFPTPVLFDPSLGLLLTSELAGGSLATEITKALRSAAGEGSPRARDIEASVLAVGRSLAGLHQSDLATAAAHPVSQELDDLRRELQLVERTWPDVAADVRRHVELLADDAPTAPDLVLSHGDFTPSQVLIDGDRPAVVDLDGLCWADPARDLGRFIAHLDLLATKAQGATSRAIVDDLAGAFLNGYLEAQGRRDLDVGAAARIDFYRRVSLLRSALHACRQLKPARLELATALLDPDGVTAGGFQS